VRGISALLCSALLLGTAHTANGAGRKDSPPSAFDSLPAAGALRTAVATFLSDFPDALRKRKVEVRSDFSGKVRGVTLTKLRRQLERAEGMLVRSESVILGNHVATLRSAAPRLGAVEDELARYLGELGTKNTVATIGQQREGGRVVVVVKTRLPSKNDEKTVVERRKMTFTPGDHAGSGSPWNPALIADRRERIVRTPISPIRKSAPER